MARLRTVTSKKPAGLSFRIQFDQIPAGYSLNACKKGEEVQIINREFVSSEDGDLFISRLEGFPSAILNKLPQDYLGIETKLNNMLALIRKDKTIQTYINYPVKGLIQVKRAVEKGGAVFKNDISDVHKFEFSGIKVPNDVGVVAIISSGWRKGLYYDLGPCSPYDGNPREYDLFELLGGYYSYITFQNRFKITDEQWKSLFINQWFPFIGLKNETIDGILNYVSNNWDTDELLEKVKQEAISIIEKKLDHWSNVEVFSEHVGFIKKAYEHYVNDDHLSCIHVLFPQIEGVLRSFQVIQGEASKSSQKDLAGIITSDKVNPKHHFFSPLLPMRFAQYLSEIYFASFNPTGEKPLSRHSVAHGVAREESFSLKGSTIGFLILDQLNYYFAGTNKKEENK